MISAIGLAAPGLFALRRPVWATVILAGVVLAALLAVPSARFDDDMLRAFSSQSQQSQDYADFLETLGTRITDIVVLAEADDPFSANDLTRLRDLALELELADHVTSVVSPFSARFAKTHPDFPGEPVFPAVIDIDEATARLAAYRATDPSLKPLIAADSRILIMAAAIDTKNDAVDIRAVLAAFRQLTQDFAGPGLRFTVTGENAITTEIVDGIQDDIVVLNAAGSAIAFLLAFLVFGQLSAALVAMIPALLGALVSVSIFVLFDYPITVISNVVPLLILVLGLADSIHLTMHLVRSDPSLPVRDRIDRSVRDIAPACGLTAITTAIAFIAIALTDNDQLFEMAVVGSLGVVVSYVVVVTTFALMAPLCARASSQPKWSTDLLRVPGAVARAVMTKDRCVIAIALVIAVASAIGFWRIEPWFPLHQYLPLDSDMRHANETIEAEFGGFLRIWSEIEATGDAALETPDGWARLTRLTAAIEDAAPDYSVISLASVARWLGTPERIPTAEEMIDVPEDLRHQLTSPQGTMARVVTFAPEPMRSHETRAVHDRIEAAALSAGAERITGLPVILRHEPIAIVGQLGIGLIAACLLAIAVVAAAFRWPTLALVLVAPNLLPLLVTASALHILNNGQANPTAVIALTIAFGIAIDDSIHFTNRYRLERERGLDVDAALDLAINQTGRVMIATTVIISAGLLVVFASAFEVVRLFGMLLILTFVTALLADLLLLPALLRQRWARR